MRRGFAIAILLFAQGASAAVRVEVDGCGSIDVPEIERLVALDLASVVDEHKDAFPPARVTCDGGKMRIVIEDPVTDKRLERQLPAPKPGEKGRERTFALAISQLYLTSWMELVMQPPPEPVGPPKDAPGATEARAVVVKKTTVAAVRTWDGEVLLGFALRAPDALGAHLRASVGGAWRATVVASWETLRVERDRGHVDATLATLGLGAMWRSARVGSLVLDARATASIVFARLDGRDGRAGTVAGGGAGTGYDLGAAVGPTFLAGPFRIGAEASAGWIGPDLKGEVSGEDPVRLDGLHWGGAVFVGLGGF